MKRTIAYMALAELVKIPAPRNPKGHSIPDLMASYRRFGFTVPPMIDERTGLLLAGHGRVEALVRLREDGESAPDGITATKADWSVPVIRGVTTRDDAEAEALVIADNQHTILGGWDESDLAEILGRHRDDLSGIGFDDDDVVLLLSRLDAAQPAAPDPDSIPAVPTDPVTKRGDVWQLGPHRVMCGDCRDSDDVAKLLDGATVNVAVTSPPYADRREYDESSGFRPIPPDEYVEWFHAVAGNVAENLAEDGSWFVNIKPGVTPSGLDTELYVLDLVLAHVRRWGWHFATEFSWDRVGVPKAVTRRFKNQFEPVYQFTLGPWKMRPDAVRHPSDDVPIALGPGTGATTWHRNQGDGGMAGSISFGPSKKVSTSLRDVQGSHVDDGRIAPVMAPNRRVRGRNSGTMSKSQGEPGGPNVGKMPRARRHPTTTLMSDSQGSPAAPGTHLMEGLAYPGNRLPTFSGSHDATGHSAAFPVGLPEFFVRAYSDEGDVVFDPFVGSGSAILAAHRTGRVGFGMELSPGYVDVAVRRFEEVTGIKPELARKS